MKLEYDAAADAAYVYVGRDGPDATVRRTEDVSTRGYYERGIDHDADGRIIGYEFLNVRRFGVDVAGLPHAEELAAAFKARGFRVTEGIGAD